VPSRTLQRVSAIWLEATLSPGRLADLDRVASHQLVDHGVLAVGGSLYLVLAYPRETRQMIPGDLPYPFLHYGLLGLLIILVVVLISNLRDMGDNH